MDTSLQKRLIVDTVDHLSHNQTTQVLAYIQSLPASYTNSKLLRRQEAMKQIRTALNEQRNRTL